MKAEHKLLHLIADKNKEIADLEKKLRDVYSYARMAKAGLDKDKTHVVDYFLERIVDEDHEVTMS